MGGVLRDRKEWRGKNRPGKHSHTEPKGYQKGSLEEVIVGKRWKVFATREASSP